MNDLNALLQRKRELTAEFKRLKQTITVPDGGILGLLSTGTAQFKPLSHIIAELLDVSDQLTERMAEKINQLEQREH
ncbi:MAG: hypothetical protein CENE_03301 [Candidatus Celerinatantimonas neptuna]|nr:MAG: hypothetical protein CENE_03301 [Candidatus Celerinatantimonas neptuna]